MCSIGHGGHQSSNQIGRLVRCLSAPLGQKAAMLIWREEGGGRRWTKGGAVWLSFFMLSLLTCSWEINTKRWEEEEEEERKRPASTCRLSAVRLGAAGLFLSTSPIRDHRAYHDGSVYVYQHNTEQKTRAHLRVRQSNPLKLKGVLDCEDNTI